MRPHLIRASQVLALVFVGILAAAALTVGQTQNNGPILRFTATSENVSGSPDQIRIDLLRWSTDAERDQFLTAWTSPAAPAAAAAGRGGAGAGGGGAAGGGRGAGGGGGRGGGRGGAPPADGAAGGARGDAPAPDAAAAGRGAPPAAPAADAAGGARGGDAAANAGGRGAAAGGGRGGRGGGGAAGGGRGGRGGDAAAPAAEAAPPTPEASFLAALQRGNTVGYLWTSEAAGYSLRFAYRYPQPDGSERIILATDRRLGSWNGLWKPNGTSTPNDYQFTVIELHLNAKGEGEGKASLAGKVAPDTNAKAVALEGYATMPVVLKAVKRTQ